MIESLFDSFILRAFAGGIGIAIIAGSLGCLVVWRRMAYFGDSLSHSALLGVALGLLSGINVNITIILVCASFAIILVILKEKQFLTLDTLLGILAHAGLSIGMVTISFIDQPDFNLHSFLFGDILTVTRNELMWIYLVGALVIILLIKNWSTLVLTTINEDLARAEGINNWRQQLLFMFLITLVVAVAIRIVGILLVTSMLIIPAASARQLARSPQAMAITASTLGICAVVTGILASIRFDTPTGPSIVTASVLIFILSVFLSQLILASHSRSMQRKNHRANH